MARSTLLRAMHVGNQQPPCPRVDICGLGAKNGLWGPSKGGHIERARGQTTRRNSTSSSQTKAGGGAFDSSTCHACGKSTTSLPPGGYLWPRGEKRPAGSLNRRSPRAGPRSDNEKQLNEFESDKGRRWRVRLFYVPCMWEINNLPAPGSIFVA